MTERHRGKPGSLRCAVGQIRSFPSPWFGARCRRSLLMHLHPGHRLWVQPQKPIYAYQVDRRFAGFPNRHLFAGDSARAFVLMLVCPATAKEKKRPVPISRYTDEHKGIAPQSSLIPMNVPTISDLK